MGIFIILLFVFLLSSSISIKFNKELEKTIFLSTFVLIFTCYCLGIVGLLGISLVAMSLVGLVNIAYILYNFKTRRVYCTKLIFRPVLLYLVLCLILIIIFSENYYVALWDEFSHWSIYVKNMFLHDSLLTLDFTDTTGYPPFVSIIQYLIMKINGTYNESALMAGILLVSSLSLTPLIKVKKTKNIFSLGLMLLVFFFPLIFFFASSTHYLSSIYIDAFLGIVMGISIFCLLIEKPSIFKIYTISAYMITLVLTKDFALVGVAVIYLLLLLDICFYQRKKYKELYFSKIRGHLIKWIQCLLPLILPLLVFISWRLFLSQFEFISSNVSKVGMQIPPYFIDVTNNFVNSLMKSPVAIGSGIVFIPTFSYFLIALCIGGYTITKFKENHRKSYFLCVSIILLFMFYCLGLIFSYVFIFSENEALKMASFGRYILTALLAVYIIVFGYILENEVSDRFAGKGPIVLMTTVIILFMDFGAIYNGAVGFFLKDSQKQEYYQQTYEKFNFVDKYVNDNENVFYINMHTDGHEYYVARYYLTPVHLQDQMWNMQDKNGKMMNIEEAAKTLSKYSYVYIDKANEEFNRRYGNLFNDSKIIDGGLYSYDSKKQIFVLVK